MKSLIISALAATGLAASVSGAFADGNPPDFYAMQRGLPYDGAKSPAQPQAQEVPPQRFATPHVYLPQYRIWVPVSVTTRPIR